MSALFSANRDLRDQAIAGLYQRILIMEYQYMRILALGLLCAIAAFAGFRFLFALVCNISHSSLEEIAGVWSALVLSVLFGIAAVVWFKAGRQKPAP